MQVVVPNALSMLSGTSVTETDYPVWNAATAYAAGDSVLRNHYIYKAISANTGKDPLLNAAGSSAVWQAMKTSNLYACLDWYRYTQTVAAGDSMTLVVPWARGSTAFALLGINAVSVSVMLSVGDTEADIIYQNTFNLLADSDGWWDYMFGDFEFTRNIIATNLPPMSGKLTVTLNGTTPALGMLVVGRQYDIGYRSGTAYGKTQLGASVRTVDYSTQEMDTLGDVTWVKRNVTGRATMTTSVLPEDVNRVQVLLDKLKSDPALWLGDNGTNSDPLNLFGFLKDVQMTYEGPCENTYEFEVEGII